MASKMWSKQNEVAETYIAPDLLVKDVGTGTIAGYNRNVEES